MIIFSKKAAKIKTAYKQDNFSGTTDIDFDFTGPTLYSSAVFGYFYFILSNSVYGSFIWDRMS